VFADRAEQQAHVFRNDLAFLQEQVVDAHDLVLVHQRHRHHGVAGVAEIGVVGLALAEGDVAPAAHRDLARGLAAHPAVDTDDALVLDQFGRQPTEPISRRWVRSSVMTRTAPACAPARRIMVDRNRPSNCSTLASEDRLVVIYDSTRNAGMLSLPASVDVCWIRGWMLSFMA
jgi:hypothetical protein